MQRQPASSHLAVYFLGIRRGKNIDLAWVFRDPEKRRKNMPAGG